MRKIQLAILEALRTKTNFSEGSTLVVVSDAGNIQMLLHDSPIVRIENNEKDMYISLAGWNTPTTRGRINIALDKYGISRVVNCVNTPEIAGRQIPTSGWIQVMRKGREIPAEVQK